MNREQDRLVQLMYAAELCQEREEARKIVTEAYMLGHSRGASLIANGGTNDNS